MCYFVVLQFHVLAPAYYDKYGQLVMFTTHGLGTPVYLVAPAPFLVSSYYNKQGKNSFIFVFNHNMNTTDVNTVIGDHLNDF